MARSVSLTLARIVEPLALGAAFATIPLTAIELSRPESNTDLVALDWALWAVFLLELALMLAVQRERRRHPGLIGLAAAVVVMSCPIWPVLLGGLQVAQLFRLVRLLRLLRLAGAVAIGAPLLRQVVRPGMVYVFGVTVLLILSAAGVLSAVEHVDYWTGVWVAIVTAATVGYGDISPHSLAGRITAVVLMVCGVGLVTTLAASIAAAFVGREEDDSMQQVLRRLERVEALLEELRDARRGPSGEDR